MDALEFFKERKRMCDFSYDKELQCDLCEAKNEAGLCSVSPRIYSSIDACKKGIEIVESWSKSHLKKTRKDDFLEKYPNAKINKDGLPEACCEDLGYGNCEFSFIDKCTECWNKSVED